MQSGEVFRHRPEVVSLFDGQKDLLPHEADVELLLQNVFFGLKREVSYLLSTGAMLEFGAVFAQTLQRRLILLQELGGVDLDEGKRGESFLPNLLAH